LKLFKLKTSLSKTSIFSKKSLFVLFFLVFFAFAFFPANNTYAMTDEEADNQAATGAYYGNPNLAKQGANARATADANKQTSEVCSFWRNPVGCLVSPIFYFAKLLLAMSQALFGWIVDTDNIKTIFSDSNNTLYKLWAFVRDFLNMGFIMMLLFSAFCTIFQIETYNYKKLLWKIVLMALLVNFSFAITRFIIDASNILMYTLIKSSLFVGKPEDIFVTLAENGDLAKLLNPTGYPDAKFLLGAAVLIFMLAITFLAVGVLLMIRIIALAILLIFSPVAFAGSFIPGLSSQASEWWKKLFNYSFFGPIMIFGIIIAIKFMSGVGETLSNAARTAAGDQSKDPTFLGAMIFILVPIILLWVVMGVAQKMGVDGASAVMGGAQKAMRWSGKNLTGYRIAKAAGGAGAHWLNRKMAETKGLRYLSPMAMKDAWKKRTARQDRKALSVSSGVIQNTLEKVIGHAATANPFIAVARFTRGFKKKGLKGGFENIKNPSDIDRTDRDYEELQTFANEEKKRITAISDNSDQILHEMNLALERGMPGDTGTVMAAHASLAKTNDLNEHQAAHGKATDPQVLKLTLAAELFAAGMKSSENIAKSLIVTGESAFSANNYGYGAMGKFLSGDDERGKKIKYNEVRTIGEAMQFYDPKTKDFDRNKEIDNVTYGKKYKAGFYMTTEKEQAEAGAAKFSNLETQSRQRLSHPDTFYNIKDGNVIDIHLGGLKTFEKFNAGDVTNAGRARETVQRHAQAWDLYNDPKNTAFKAKIDKLSNAAIVIEHLKTASDIIKNPPVKK